MNDYVKAHLARYPLMEVRDVAKLLYQGAFGCEHLVANSQTAKKRLCAELKAIEGKTPDKQTPRFESVSADFVRFNLFELKSTKLSVETLNKMFVASSKMPSAGKDAFLKELFSIRTDAASGELPFDKSAYRAFLHDYLQAGCGAVSHSETYRNAYSPAYRVLAKAFETYFPLFEKIDETVKSKGKARIAIDGMSASGKTTLAELIKNVYNCNVFHADDYFLPKEMRTEKRLSEPFGNLHYERMKSEIIDSVREGKDVTYRPYSCQSGEILAPIEKKATAVTVIEGSYSSNPYFGEAYDAVVCMKIDPTAQIVRIAARNGEEMLSRFQNEWIPLENRYIAETDLEDRSALTFFVKR